MHRPTGSTVFVYGKITLMIHSTYFYTSLQNNSHIKHIKGGSITHHILPPVYATDVCILRVYMMLSLLGLDLVNSILIIVFPLPFQKIQTL